MLEPLAEHIHHAPARYFPLKPVQKLRPADLASHTCPGPFLRLSFAEKTEEPRFINRILTAIVLVAALLVAVDVDQMLNNERLKTGFTGIGRHGDLTQLY